MAKNELFVNRFDSSEHFERNYYSIRLFRLLLQVQCIFVAFQVIIVIVRNSGTQTNIGYLYLASDNYSLNFD